MKTFFIEIILSAIFSAYASCDILSLNDQRSVCQSENCSNSQTVITLNLGYIKMESSNESFNLDLPDELGVGKGFITGPGMTLLPVYTVLLATPPEAQLSFDINNNQQTEYDNLVLARADSQDSQWPNSTITDNGLWPENIIRLESAGIMRDLKIARLTICPVQYDSRQKHLVIHHNLRLTVHHQGSNVVSGNGSISEAFVPIYKGFLANAELLSQSSVKRGEYWFIVNDSYSQNISSLVNWKKSMGYATRVFNLSSIGFNPSAMQIRNFILQQFNNAQVKPDYICIIGDAEEGSRPFVPTYTYSNPFGFGTIDSDNYYTFLVGQDYFPDVLIGRISISNALELNDYLAKHSDYERNPYMADTIWYHQATVVAGYDGGAFASPRLTKLWCREMMLDHGFTSVDTFFATNDYWPPNPDIIASLSRGALFVNFRGTASIARWDLPPFGVNDFGGITNGPKYGIMHSIVCATGDFNDLDCGLVCIGEAWIRLSNRGGPGFIGTTNHDAHTKWTNTLDCGIYWGLFMTGARTLAQSQLAGKMTLYLTFPESTNPGGEVELYYHSYNVLGDPGLNCWIGVPKTFLVSYPASIGVGSTGIDVSVTDLSALPLSNVYICLWKGQEVFDGQFTGNDGQAHFQVACPDTGSIKLTATSPDYRPFEGEIAVLSSLANLGLLRFTVDDDTLGASNGDADQNANPGERIELFPTLQNFNDSQTALGTGGVITTTDSLITINEDSSAYGDIGAGDTARAVTPYVIDISPSVENGHIARINLSLNSSAGPVPINYLLLPITAASLKVGQTTIEGDNNNDHIIDPGETGQLIVRLDNSGAKNMIAAAAVLHCYDSKVQLIDSTANYGDIDTNQNVSNNADPFVFHVSSDAYVGRSLNFSIRVVGAGGVRQTCEFTLTVGTLNPDDPIGPDDYGYYCFDNTDTAYSEHPAYDWIPIDTLGNYVSLNDDQVATINLPFTVKYYGNNYNQITICDNGYIAFGQTWWANFQNARIPGPQCAKAMVAPCWDDFSGLPQLKVYYKHYPATGQFVIGWLNADEHDQSEFVSFEIILLDGAVSPTRTGDNEIIFQYAPNAANLISNSVGICNEDRTIGIQYQYNQIYAAGAAPLSNQRAIKFTTLAPIPCLYLPGDINGDHIRGGGDVTYGVRYFKGLGPAPIDSCYGDSITTPNHYLHASGDVNGNCEFRGSDISRLVAYFKGRAYLNYCHFFPPPILREGKQLQSQKK